MKKRFILYLILLSLLFTSCSKEAGQQASVSNGEFLLCFLDVGQADSILVSCDGEHMLIDAGNNQDGDTVVEYLRERKVESLRYAVGTHPHADHIGGLDTVLNTIKADTVLLPNKISNTATFEDVLDAIDAGGMSVTLAQAGDTYSLGSASFEVLSPGKDYGNELNNWSVVIRLTYKEHSFLFTGDAEKEAERDMLAAGYTLTADVLKVGHHGSSTSSSMEFLTAICPKIAIVQCGTDNDYGHPHAETINRLQKIGAQIFRTDLNGTIMITLEGDGLVVSSLSEPGSVIQSNENSSSGMSSSAVQEEYILNNNSKKFHLPACSLASKINSRNKGEYRGNREELIKQGYSPCSVCKP